MREIINTFREFYILVSILYYIIRNILHITIFNSINFLYINSIIYIRMEILSIFLILILIVIIIYYNFDVEIEPKRSSNKIIPSNDDDNQALIDAILLDEAGNLVEKENEYEGELEDLSIGDKTNISDLKRTYGYQQKEEDDYLKSDLVD